MSTATAVKTPPAERETLSEGDGSETVQRAWRGLLRAHAGLSKRLDAELEQVFQEWDRAIAASGSRTAAGDGAQGLFHVELSVLPDEFQSILNRLNEILNRRSYIRNLVAGVQNELAGA